MYKKTSSTCHIPRFPFASHVHLTAACRLREHTYVFAVYPCISYSDFALISSMRRRQLRPHRYRALLLHRCIKWISLFCSPNHAPWSRQLGSQHNLLRVSDLRAPDLRYAKSTTLSAVSGSQSGETWPQFTCMHNMCAQAARTPRQSQAQVSRLGGSSSCMMRHTHTRTRIHAQCVQLCGVCDTDCAATLCTLTDRT